MKGNTMFDDDYSLETFNHKLAIVDSLLGGFDTDYLEAVAEAGDYLDNQLIDFVSTLMTL